LNVNNINLEQVVLKNILTNEDYMRKVLPYIRPDYFEGVYKKLFIEIGLYVGKYNKLPSLETFKVSIDDKKWTAEHYAHIMEIVPSLFSKDNVTDETWLHETTEKWCQDRALHNAIMESITIIDGKHSTLTKTALPEILQKALGVSFDSMIGHNYFDNAEERYEFYHTEEQRIPFDIEMLNKITKGGLALKSLNIILAGCVHPDTKVTVRIKRKPNL